MKWTSKVTVTKTANRRLLLRAEIKYKGIEKQGRAVFIGSSR